MNCPSCKQVNAQERNFCGACGSPLARFCQLCGFRNLAPDRFCGGCGGSLTAAAAGLSVAAASAGADTAPCPAQDDGLAELLEAATDHQELPSDDSSGRISQEDIDALFED